MATETEPTTNIHDDTTGSHLLTTAEMGGWFENDARALAAAITDMMASSGGGEGVLRTIQNLRHGAGGVSILLLR